MISYFVGVTHALFTPSFGVCGVAILSSVGLGPSLLTQNQKNPHCLNMIG